MIGSLLEESLNFRNAAEVGGQCDAAAAKLFDVGDGFAGMALRRTVVNHDVGAVLRQTQGDGPAQALSRTRDNGDAIQKRSLPRPETLTQNLRTIGQRWPVAVFAAVSECGGRVLEWPLEPARLLVSQEWRTWQTE
jgi:hypothetical protein